VLARGANGVVDRIVGGWQLSGVLIFQSGPFLTVTTPNADPLGLVFPQLSAHLVRTFVSGAALYPDVQSPSAVGESVRVRHPPDAIGRFATAPVGNVADRAPRRLPRP